MVRTIRMIIGQILTAQPTRMLFIDHDGLIQRFPSATANPDLLV
jgi:hypothetical protein